MTIKDTPIFSLRSFSHNPRNNTFTSVYEAPVNIKARMQNQASGEVRPRLQALRPGTPAACHLVDTAERSGYCHTPLLSCLDARQEVISKAMLLKLPLEMIHVKLDACFTLRYLNMFTDTLHPKCITLKGEKSTSPAALG